MSCLLPQFKCQPDTFCIQFRTPLSKIRGPVYLRTQCVLSTISAPPTSTATSTLLDMEKLQISSLETHSNPVSAQSRWTHMEAIGPPTEASFQATLARETLVTSDDAIIAAAAEAVSFAKAAIKVAEDAKAMTTNNFQNGDKKSKPSILSEVNAMQSNWVQQCIESEKMSEFGVSVGAESEVGEMEDRFLQYLTNESSCPEPTNEELAFLEQLSSAAAVRSTRQSERKARRERAMEKATEKAAATNVMSLNNDVSVKMGSTRKRKTRATRKSGRNEPFRYDPESKLLTAAEERTLSEGIQDLLKVQRLQEELTTRCQGVPTCAQLANAAGVDQRTLNQMINYGAECKEKMIRSNIRLVISVAKKYNGAGMDFQDLIAEGSLGLIRASEKFDPAKGYKFSTYAHWWIRQTIRRALSTKGKFIRVPQHLASSSYKVWQARDKFYNEHRRYPDNEELAKASGLTMKKLIDVLKAPRKPISFERRKVFGGFDEGLKFSDILYDPNAETPDEAVIKMCLREDINKVLNTLNARERQVIRWRHGLVDGRARALQEIGELMSISRERVRQIEACAVRKLKSKKRVEHLRPYLYK
uniref:Sigma factor n=1 Tax=Pelargonium tetragonum TaxID=122197 RepID=A0A0G2STP7_9ROSI|nr:sigma factor [Pelargonium tetragonum]